MLVSLWIVVCGSEMILFIIGSIRIRFQNAECSGKDVPVFLYGWPVVWLQPMWEWNFEGCRARQRLQRNMPFLQPTVSNWFVEMSKYNIGKQCPHDSASVGKFRRWLYIYYYIILYRPINAYQVITAQLRIASIYIPDWHSLAIYFCRDGRFCWLPMNLTVCLHMSHDQHALDNLQGRSSIPKEDSYGFIIMVLTLTLNHLDQLDDHPPQRATNGTLHCSTDFNST